MSLFRRNRGESEGLKEAKELKLEALQKLKETHEWAREADAITKVTDAQLNVNHFALRYVEALRGKD